MHAIQIIRHEHEAEKHPHHDDLTHEFHRLPTYATPINYNVVLKPDLKTFALTGTEEILIEVHRQTTELRLHALESTVSCAEWIDSVSGRKQSSLEIKYNEDEELVIFTFGDTLNVGKGTLRLEFQGQLLEGLSGFYKFKIQLPNGEEVYNAVTQFEATSARKCFPCFDEPALKATFDLAMVVPNDKTALSNMPVKNKKPFPCGRDPNLVAISYERTPIMSTYLVAFTVGDYDYVEAYTPDKKVLCRVYTPLGKSEQGRFALDVTIKLMPYFNDYFGIDYPLPKYDLVAVTDFDMGAMENYGMTVFKDTQILLDQYATTTHAKQIIAIVVAHELSHQWFGNLVTMDWWDGLFLKEGYATFVETMSVHYLFPEFDMWTQFVYDAVIKSMQMDSLQSSHPIFVPVANPVEVEEIFDDISYRKGGSVIRMLEYYVGKDAFKEGMRIYLNRHQYNNTKPSDLWTAMEEASGKRISEIMTTWTNQMGFPFLKVEVRHEATNRILTITQKKFWNDRKLADDPNACKNYKWLIPLTFCTENDPLKIIEGELMTGDSITVTIPYLEEDQWVKLNPGFTGYYRVRYTPEMLSQFIPAIKAKTLPPVDRLNLLNDSFAMAKSGETSTVELLKIMLAFKDDDDGTVWTTIDHGVGVIFNLLVSFNDLHEKFKIYGRQLYSSIIPRLGWDPKPLESHGDKLLRPLLLSRMISLDHNETIDKGISIFNEYIRNNRQIDVDLKSVVFKAALSDGKQETYDHIINSYKAANMAKEKDDIAQSLVGSRDISILKQTLEFSISDNVSPVHGIHMLKRLSFSGTGALGRDLVWDFFKENWNIFKERYPSGKMVVRLLTYNAESFETEEHAEDIKSFFKTHSLPAITDRVLEEVIEKVNLNHAWLQRDLSAITDFLAEYNEN